MLREFCSFEDFKKAFLIGFFLKLGKKHDMIFSRKIFFGKFKKNFHILKLRNKLLYEFF